MNDLPFERHDRKSAATPIGDPLQNILGFKRFRYRLEYWVLEAGAWLVRHLPYESLQPIANFLGAVAFALDKRGRLTALENLKSAFGDEMPPEQRKRVARGSYRNFARTILCLFWSPNLTESNFTRYIRIEGVDDHPCHKDTAHAGIYFCAHFGNFEWLSHASAFAVQRGPIIFQRFKNPLLGPVFSRLRATSGHDIIPQERAIIRMLKYLKTGRKFGVLTDLSLDPRHQAVPIRCFGLWTAASPLLSTLYARTHAKLIHCECLPQPDGTYIARYANPLEFSREADDRDVTQACWNKIEASIRQHPELWLWMYKQWRFKPGKGDSSRYPAYANTAKRFDRMLRA